MVSTLCVIFVLMVGYRSVNADLVLQYHRLYRAYLATMENTFNEFHDKRVRPITNQDDAMSVTVEFQIISVSKLDTFTGSMDFAGRLVMKWRDVILADIVSKNPDLAITGRLVEQDSLWTPDIVVYNSMNERTRLGDPSYRIRLDDDGNCEWLLGVVDSTSCTFDVTLFPFDKPACTIIFTTWRYNYDEINISPVNDSIDLSLYNPNSEWTVENSTSNLTIINNVPYLNYTIYFKREGGFYLVNMILPIIVVSLLNAMVFLVPTESGERLVYAVLLFLWFIVYLDIISTNLPVSSDNISNLSLLVICMVGLSVLTIFLDVISIMIYHRDEKKHIPRCLESFVRCLRCRCGGSNANRIIAFEDVESSNGSSKPMLNDMAPTTVALGTKSSLGVQLRLKDFETPRDRQLDKKAVDSNDEKRKRKSDEIDWKTVSVTFDYIFFIFTLFATLGLCGFFLVPLIRANNS